MVIALYFFLLSKKMATAYWLDLDLKSRTYIWICISNTYTAYIYAEAPVHLDSLGSSGIQLTPGLTSSTSSSVRVNTNVHTRTHFLCLPTPHQLSQKILPAKYAWQNLYFHPWWTRQNRLNAFSMAKVGTKEDSCCKHCRLDTRDRRHQQAFGAICPAFTWINDICGCQQSY